MASKIKKYKVTSAKVWNGQFKNVKYFDKYFAGKVSHKLEYSDGNYYSYTYDRILVRDDLVQCLFKNGGNTFTPKSFKQAEECLSYVEKRVVDPQFYICVSANYKKGRYSSTHFNLYPNSLGELKKLEEDLDKNDVDKSKCRIQIVLYDFWRKMTKDEIDAIQAYKDKLVADKKKAAEKEKRAAEKEKRAAEEAKKLAAAEKKKEIMLNKLADTADVAVALKILQDKGLNVVVVKDGKSGI